MTLSARFVRVLFVAGACLPAAAHAEEPSADWADGAAHDGIRLGSRVRAGSKIREVRAVATIDASPERVLAVLSDVQRYPQFMPPTEETQLLRKDGDAAIFYMLINPPVVSRRDYCIRVAFERLPSGLLRSTWRATNEGCLLPKSNTVRVTETDGEWVLEPIDDGKRTRAYYRCHIEIRGHIPSWMVNSGATSQLPAVFAALRRATTDPRYAKCLGTPAGCIPHD